LAIDGGFISFKGRFYSIFWAQRGLIQGKSFQKELPAHCAGIFADRLSGFFSIFRILSSRDNVQSAGNYLKGKPWDKIHFPKNWVFCEEREPARYWIVFGGEGLG